MRIARTVRELRDEIEPIRRSGGSIGFVPTMGCLHEGHYTLIRRAGDECDCVVVSIFVNPTQFGPGEDFEKYPRVFEDDCRGCEAESVDVVFAPPREEVYPEGAQTFVAVEGLSQRYCGEARPGHFRGVATVVAALFNVVDPDVSYFGEKDFQQVRVIERMVKDLHFRTKITVIPTFREADGLAMSSRNRYLNPTERKAAATLYRSIQRAVALVQAGETDGRVILNTVTEAIAGEPLVKLQYAEIADDETLEPAPRVTGNEHLLLAAYVGKTRLIDNAPLGSRKKL